MGMMKKKKTKSGAALCLARCWPVLGSGVGLEIGLGLGVGLGLYERTLIPAGGSS